MEALGNFGSQSVSANYLKTALVRLACRSNASVSARGPLDATFAPNARFAVRELLEIILKRQPICGLNNEQRGTEVEELLRR